MTLGESLVSDGAGRSVTVSNWGVAQTSRQQKFASAPFKLGSLYTHICRNNCNPAKTKGQVCVAAHAKYLDFASKPPQVDE
jgi:hypothetical protein